MAVTSGNNTAPIGFEQQIWAAADILCGNMVAAEYKHFVIGLIFLKYISDKFEERYHELETDDDQRWKYGLPPSGNTNFAWLQHIIFHLAPNSKIGMVLANGSPSLLQVRALSADLKEVNANAD